MRNNSWNDGWLQNLGASQTQPDDWWQKWRQEAGQHGLLNAPEQPAQPTPPVDTPDPATGGASGGNPFSWIQDGIPWDDERFRDMDGAGRFFAPLMFGMFNWFNDRGVFDKMNGGGGSAGSDWWQKWRDESGHKGLL